LFSFFDTKIEFLKGVGPQKAALINKELNIFTFGELIQHYPFRYEDRTQFFKINELTEDLEHVQIVAKIRSAETIGEGQRKRLVATIFDETGEMELTWFKGIQYVVKKLVPGIPFVFFGKPNKYGRKFSIAHPEMEALSAAEEEKSFFQPVYPTTEKLRSRFLDSKGISKIMEGLVTSAFPQIQETLPEEVLQRFNLIPKKDAVKEIHFPENPEFLKRAIFRLKFEEFFFMQLRLLKLKLTRTEKSQGQILNQTELLNVFYKEHIPFELTEAQ
jgi:ATP-dependent DNA helicase RecG